MVRDLRDLRSNESTDADASVDIKEDRGREEEALVGVGGRTGKRWPDWKTVRFLGFSGALVGGITTNCRTIIGM
jgi:hypothetical protein